MRMVPPAITRTTGEVQAREALTYRNEALRALTLPLGGLGTGCVAIAGDGGLRQWQIGNNVNHDAHVPGSFFAIWAGGWRDAKRNAVVLQCDKLYDEGDFVPAPSVSDHLVPHASRELLQELPGVDDVTITAQYPIVEVEYDMDRFPAAVKLEAFSPFVPLDSANSGLPAVLFNFTVTNQQDRELSVSIMAAQQNIAGWDGKTDIDGVRNLGYGGNVNDLIRLEGITALDMHNPRLSVDAPSNGRVVLALLNDPDDEVTVMPQWNSVSHLWSNFESLRGRLPNQGGLGASPDGQTWNGAVAVHFKLAPGATRTVTYALAWYFPNRYVTWFQNEFPYIMGIPDSKTKFWLGNAYTTRHPSALAVVEYVRDHFDRLVSSTRMYRDRFFSSTLPWELLESVAGPVSTLRSPTCLWVEDGRFHGFEGCHGVSTQHGAFDGCCPMNCTHVWNYEMALAKLFPDLEQGMRRTDLIDQISPWGSIPHRTTLPLYLSRPWDTFIGGPRNPAMDGELGTVLKTYREIRHGASQEWFDEMWPAVKRLMAHVMTDYDSEGDGVIRGEQPNTYDISIYGPNTFIGSLYMAALRAAEEMALLQGESELAQQYHERFKLGRENYDKICWTGEYYAQIVDLDEYAEQQFGSGCHVDQLLGQWWAHLLDLGYVLPEEHVRETVHNIYRNNRRVGFRREEQRPRIYMDERDRGLYICTWPHGGKPDVPTQYSDEVWSGLEYPVAALLLHQGETEEALTLLADIRDRHDGTRRSPWNEVECGDHYVRPMASWSLLEIASGYRYNAVTKELAFAPRLAPEDFQSFFITGSGWGGYWQRSGEAGLILDYGSLTLRSVSVPLDGTLTVRVNQEVIRANTTVDDGVSTLVFAEPIALSAGDELIFAAS